MGPGFEFSINLRYMLDKCIGATVTTKKHSYICIKDQKHIRKIKNTKIGKAEKNNSQILLSGPPKIRKKQKTKKTLGKQKTQKNKKNILGKS